jgi:hypothetical protein
MNNVRQREALGELGYELKLDKKEVEGLGKLLEYREFDVIAEVG